ncbi:hypothetical protein [Peribacillus asahii]|uniref:hypothetical protein n=1 Tax=Peribacillus asahii TaxID=228899 RepID=UPI00207A0422|nr:hypothetical protein [Peribacillus asahii]USK68408.1 hypothetical protein LIS76_12330 [Peribacillus asahii]
MRKLLLLVLLFLSTIGLISKLIPKETPEEYHDRMWEVYDKCPSAHSKGNYGDMDKYDYDSSECIEARDYLNETYGGELFDD